MRSAKQRFTKYRRGAVAVELAILSPLLILLVFGGIEVGQFVNSSQLVSNASREGARKASRHQTLTVTEVETTVYDYLDNAAGIPSSAVQVSVVDGDGNSVSGSDITTIASGEPVSVQVTVPFASVRWIGFFGLLDGKSNTTTTTARRE